MAITHRAFVLFTFPLCCASVALLITALSTRSWFDGISTYKDSDLKNNINYGLFVGTHVKRILETPKTYDIYMTCLTDEGVCAWSCLATVEAREQQVRELLATGLSTQQCSPVALETASASKHLQYWVEPTTNDTVHQTQVRLLDSEKPCYEIDQTFISLGTWASTIAFIALGILMASVGAAFAVVNTAGNPVEPILGILGLFIWNASAVVADVIALAIWGSEFAITLVNNAVLPETISGENCSKGLAALGYSYWLLLLSAVLHLVCIGLLLYRRHLILTEPPAPTIRMEEDPDGAIFLY